MAVCVCMRVSACKRACARGASPMNKDVPPPWTLDANAGASDSANTLQCENVLPETSIRD